MKDVPLLLVRALVGGTFVVAFSLVSETLKPKEFAGIFSAAPAVALGSLLLTLLTKGPDAVVTGTLGMIASALAMFAYCLAGAALVRRLGSLRGSVAALPVWIAGALGGYLLFLR
jgi:uncharacterized membrane protein (GlpM family)